MNRPREVNLPREWLRVAGSESAEDDRRVSLPERNGQTELPVTRHEVDKN